MQESGACLSHRGSSRRLLSEEAVLITSPLGASNGRLAYLLPDGYLWAQRSAQVTGLCTRVNCR
jgi:hypothetical protein